MVISLFQMLYFCDYIPFDVSLTPRPCFCTLHTAQQRKQYRTMGASIFWRGAEEVTVFEQTEESFIRSGGGMAIIDINTCRMVPIKRIYMKPGEHRAQFELMRPCTSDALNRMAQ